MDGVDFGFFQGFFCDVELLLWKSFDEGIDALLANQSAKILEKSFSLVNKSIYTQNQNTRKITLNILSLIHI